MTAMPLRHSRRFPVTPITMASGGDGRLDPRADFQLIERSARVAMRPNASPTTALSAVQAPGPASTTCRTCAGFAPSALRTRSHGRGATSVAAAGGVLERFLTEGTAQLPTGAAAGVRRVTALFQLVFRTAATVITSA